MPETVAAGAQRSVNAVAEHYGFSLVALTVR